MASTRRLQPMYPFCAVVGQDAMKLGLILNVINPRVGGLLIRGEKGAAKSTTVRALAGILPEIEVVADCPYSCDPADVEALCQACRNNGVVAQKRGVRVVELPLNATEEMVVGGLDFSASIHEGLRVFQPGLMAHAHRGILYIDEVNLLSDHVVDAILDVSASGKNVVQREGITHRHPARFTLVGTMNPEEGELRPQLLDRFGLCVEVHGGQDVDSRIEVLQRRDAFDREPGAFCDAFAGQDRRLKERIEHARALLPTIGLPRRLDRLIADICAHYHVAGHRADIVIAQASRALAAFEGRAEAIMDDVRQAAALALPHRARKPDAPRKSSPEPPEASVPHKAVRRHGYPEDYPEQEPVRSSKRDTGGEKTDPRPLQRFIQASERPEAIFDIGPTFQVRAISQRSDKLSRQGTGKRSRTRTKGKKGRYVRSTAHRLTNDVALDATLRAAAPHQLKRKADAHFAVKIRDEDIREKVRETRSRNFLLFIVDASGSMGAKGRMAASKGAVMSLLKDAYQKRDRVAMVSFRRQEAVVNLPPTSSIHRAGQLLKELPVGGKTPLAAGLRKGQEMLRSVLLKDPTCRPILIVITDGKANQSVGKGDPCWEALSAAKGIATDNRIKAVVVDAEEDGNFRYNFSARLAQVLRADYFRIRDLRADILLEIVRSGV